MELFDGDSENRKEWQNMIYIGCHLSIADGYEAMGKTMSRFGGNTFAWFTRNPRGGRIKQIFPEQESDGE